MAPAVLVRRWRGGIGKTAWILSWSEIRILRLNQPPPAEKIVTGETIQLIAPQHPGHLSKESPFCDRGLLGVITDQGKRGWGLNRRCANWNSWPRGAEQARQRRKRIPLSGLGSLSCRRIGYSGPGWIMPAAPP